MTNCVRLAPCVFLAALGCGEISFPPIQYETRRARIGTSLDYELCAGDLELIDTQIDEIESRLGVRRGTLELYLYGADELPCGASPFGCYYPEQDVVATRPNALAHELVHALARDVDFEKLFWAEGVAEALKGGGTLYGGESPLETYNESDSARLNYASAGHFTRWLIETTDLLSTIRIAQGENPELLLGSTLDELAAAYGETAPWAYPDWEPCSFSPLNAIEPGVWDESFDFDCQTSGAQRLVLGAGPALVRSVVLSAGAYDLAIEGDQTVWVRGCHMETILNERPSWSEDNTTPLYWNGDVFNEAQFGLAGQFTAYPSGQEHEIQLTEGTYQIVVEAIEGQDSVAGSVHLERRD